tara:strand:+ start:484 stop:720 length:237 start_codon:yes stop_codon:yes gene_type:complete
VCEREEREGERSKGDLEGSMPLSFADVCHVLFRVTRERWSGCRILVSTHGEFIETIPSRVKQKNLNLEKEAPICPEIS